jgi:hypothetical protein
MPDKQVVHFFHGNAVKLEFPNHYDWFVPDLIKHLNRALAAVNDPVCKILVKDNNEDLLEIEISDGDMQHLETLSYTAYSEKLDDFIVDLIRMVNSRLAYRFGGYVIAPLRSASTENDAFTVANLYLAFASRLEVLNGISGYSLLGDVDRYLSLLPEQAGEMPQIPVRLTLEELRLQYQSDLYDGRHYLPAYPDKEAPGWMREELEKVLALNPERTIQLNIDPLYDAALDKMNVVFTSGGLETVEHLDKWNFYELGLMFNRFLKDSDRRYCLLRPDEDNFIYACCDRNEFERCMEHDYVEVHYLNIFDDQV